MTGPRSPRRTRPHGSALTRDELGRKHCIRCDQWKTEEFFTTAKSSCDGLHSWCKKCHSEHQRMRLYGLTPQCITRMLEAQDNQCCICAVEFDDDFRIDHDHDCCPGITSCGKCIRGLLCRHCNSGLGNFRDSPRLLGSAIGYLAGSGVT